MDVTESLKMPETAPEPLSMTSDAIRSRARRAKKKAKPKPKKRPPAKSKKKLKAKAKPKAKAGAVVRSERLEVRLTKAEKAKITARAKKTRRTVTSLVIEAIEKIK
jgi:hypothetical protein